MLRTDRMLLRRWRPEDLEPYAALCADPVVMEHFPALMTRAESAASIERMTAHFDREGFGLWAVEVPGVAACIGFTGLSRPTFLPAEVEVGWRLARAYWGAGYATEAARAALQVGFETYHLPEIISMTAPANVRSQAVMLRLGFTRDATADFEHPSIPVGHPLRPHWMFRLAR
ncbi:MAG: GNAT family N-acetyltransferase [Kofleriaceae bacterium]